MTKRTTYRAKWLLVDPWTVLENGYVSVSGRRIEAVGSGKPPGDIPVIDLGPGVMTPPLVNAHTHLELSALFNLLPFDRGFPHWTADLIQKRAEFTKSELVDAAKKAAEQMAENGGGAVADISTLGFTYELLQDSTLGGIFFHEHLGNTLPESPKLEAAFPLSSSLAAHAPHTTAPDLLRGIKQATTDLGLPMSLHLAESEAEVQFIQSGRGDWADFLTHRGIDFSDWPLPSESPVQYLHQLGILGAGTLAVHLLQCSDEDMKILKKTDTSACFCPRSNLQLHGLLPDISGFLSIGIKPCLGTDSLASCPSLNILDEMAFVSLNYDTIPPADIIAMGTINGAAALGIEAHFGRLAPGFAGPPVHTPIQTDAIRNVARDYLTCGDPRVTDTHGKAEP